MVCFGIALAFKLQAVFLAPVLVALALRGSIPWKALLVIPSILLLALVPVVGWQDARLIELLNIYAEPGVAVRVHHDECTECLCLAAPVQSKSSTCSMARA